MKIICGIYQADGGEVILDGKTLKLKDYNDAIHNGISIVNQEINLIPESSIAENIVLDKMDQFTKLGFVNWNKVNELARKYMDMVGLRFDPKTPVMKLSAAHKQLIQIAKALSAQRQGTHARRADFEPDAVRGEHTLRSGARTEKEGRHHDLRLPQVGGSHGDLRQGDGAAATASTSAPAIPRTSPSRRSSR